MNGKTKFRISIGAIAGSILLGGATYTLMSLQKERTIIPFYKETIERYAVNSKTISIEKGQKEQNDIVETNDKEYLTKMQLDKINSIEINTYLWSMDEEEKERKNITRDVYQYSFDYESLTTEEINKKIELFASGDLEKVYENYNWSKNYSETPVIIPEELEPGFYTADMTVYNIDYEDVDVEKQTSEDDLYESFFLTMAALIGGISGWTGELSYRIDRSMNRRQSKQKKKILQ